jgi:hypothetical protein
VLRRIFVLKRDDMLGWRKLLEEIHSLYSSPNEDKIKEKRERREEKRLIHTGFCGEARRNEITKKA